MRDEELLATLGLTLAAGIGPVIGRKLLDSFGSAVAARQATAKQLAAIDGVGAKLAAAIAAVPGAAAEALLQQCRQYRIDLLADGDPCYPALLRQLPDAPLLLYCYGDINSLSAERLLAMVGSRRATREGRLIARRWAKRVVEAQVVVVSGMAQGIDGAAHGGALEGGGKTVAVLGCGLLALNGEQQRQRDAVAEHGCVISEYLPHQLPRPELFPRRNRIIAGLSAATVVVEAGLDSGSLITARLALDNGRELFAIPGSVLTESHAGCHKLIRDGAHLVDTPSFLLDVLGWGESRKTRTIPAHLSREERHIIELLSGEILHLDALAERCGLTIPTLSPILLALELGGLIEKLPGSRYTLAMEA